MRLSASFRAKGRLNACLQCCLTAWLTLSNPVEMNETCVYPRWASRLKLHVIVLWVLATPWGFVIILKQKKKKEISLSLEETNWHLIAKTYHLK